MKDKAKILVVDDDDDIVLILEKRLVCFGYSVISAGSGKEALKKIALDSPDLVILDLMLPGSSGEEVCKQIRRNPRLSALPVIMLTAKDSETDKVIGKVIGADCYITKPFDVTQLIDKIDELLKV